MAKAKILPEVPADKHAPEPKLNYLDIIADYTRVNNIAIGQCGPIWCFWPYSVLATLGRDCDKSLGYCKIDEIEKQGIDYYPASTIALGNYIFSL
jgi:hypothetical protein